MLLFLNTTDIVKLVSLSGSMETLFVFLFSPVKSLEFIEINLTPWMSAGCRFFCIFSIDVSSFFKHSYNYAYVSKYLCRSLNIIGIFIWMPPKHNSATYTSSCILRKRKCMF